MSFLKSILKQNAVYQSNFQMSRQCLQRSDVFYLTLQRFTVSTYIGDGLQSEDFQTFLVIVEYSKSLHSADLHSAEFRLVRFSWLDRKIYIVLNIYIVRISTLLKSALCKSIVLNICIVRISTLFKFALCMSKFGAGCLELARWPI